MINKQRHPASFKDPAGFIFLENGHYLRQVNPSYAAHYDLLMRSGLYSVLVGEHWLLPHEELSEHRGLDGKAYKVLLPEQVPFASYPYEWSFDMLRDAALLTLAITRKAISHGMILKDATAYNVLYANGRPVFIDTLSFETYTPTQPWVAYRQFCQHFLFPLLVNHYNGVEAQQWMQLYADGLPLYLTAAVLPYRTRWKLATAMHVHLQHRVSMRQDNGTRPVQFSERKMLHLLDHLASIIRSLRPGRTKTEWKDYYRESIMSTAYLREKESVFRSFLSAIHVRTAIDLGANTGHFSLLLAEAGVEVIATDADTQAVNDLYLTIRKEKLTNIHPLVIDLAYPSPAIGWENDERKSFLARAKAELVVALALVHHLYFTYNIPLDAIARCLAKTTYKYCIVEMILPTDDKVVLISKGKASLLPGFITENFEASMKSYFAIREKVSLIGGERILYLLEKTTSNDEA